MITISTAIQAVPERTAMVDRLRLQLGVRAPTFWDEEHRGPLFGWLGALRLALSSDPTSTHVLVLQDDALPCTDLLGGVALACAAAPLQQIVYFVTRAERVAGERALARNLSLMPVRNVYGPGNSMPRDYATGFLEWASSDHRDLDRPGYLVSKHDDRMMQEYAKATGRRILATFPSLVEHGAPDQSTLGHRRGLVAWWFLGETTSALTVDWRAPT